MFEFLVAIAWIACVAVNSSESVSHRRVNTTQFVFSGKVFCGKSPRKSHITILQGRGISRAACMSMLRLLSAAAPVSSESWPDDARLLEYDVLSARRIPSQIHLAERAPGNRARR